jgi:hypothetical protein
MFKYSIDFFILMFFQCQAFVNVVMNIRFHKIRGVC